MKTQRLDSDCLIGQKIISVEQTGKRSIKFVTQSGNVELEFDPDGCSEAYIYDVRGKIDGKIVKSVIVTKDLTEALNDSWIVSKIKTVFGATSLQESNSIWGFDIKTTDGELLEIRHLNSSNGYYNSSANWSGIIIPNQYENKYSVEDFDICFDTLDDTAKFQNDSGFNPRQPKRVWHYFKNQIGQLESKEIDLVESGFIAKRELNEEEVKKITQYEKYLYDAAISEFHEKSKNKQRSIITGSYHSAFHYNIGGRLFSIQDVSFEDWLKEPIENAKYSWKI